jgi:hypothetical protein
MLIFTYMPFILNVIMLNVVMTRVVAPSWLPGQHDQKKRIVSICHCPTQGAKASISPAGITEAIGR